MDDTIVSRKRRKPSACELCEREQPLTFHHLIPKKNHRKSYFKRRYSKEELVNRGLWLCRLCHRHLHKTFDEKELGRQLNTRRTLLERPEVQTFLAWARRQK